MNERESEVLYRITVTRARATAMSARCGGVAPVTIPALTALAAALLFNRYRCQNQAVDLRT